MELGEKENNFFLDVEVPDVILEAEAGGGVDDDVEAGFFFNFAHGGLDFGFVRLDMAFGEAPEVVLLVDEEGATIMGNDGAARFFVFHEYII